MKKLKEIILEIRPDIELSESTRLITDGHFDSLDVIKLISELDEVYEISINGEDIVPEKLDTLVLIKSLVDGYLSK